MCVPLVLRMSVLSTWLVDVPLLPLACTVLPLLALADMLSHLPMRLMLLSSPAIAPLSLPLVSRHLTVGPSCSALSRILQRN